MESQASAKNRRKCAVCDRTLAPSYWKTGIFGPANCITGRIGARRCSALPDLLRTEVVTMWQELDEAG